MIRHAKVLFAIAALVAVFAVPSNASASKAVDSFFGNPTSATGTIGGQFNTPRGVAVNNTTGDIYVVDGSNNRIQQFDSSNNFIRAWGQDVIVATGPPPNSNGTGFEICDTTAGNVAAECKAGITSASTGGAMSSPQGVAVNNTTGHVYVTDGNFLRVQEFTATGQFVRAWGQDVVSTGPGNLGAAEVQSLKVKATSGTFTLTFSGQTTGALPFNIPANGGVGATASVQNALNALTSISPGGGSVTVTGGPGDATGSSPYQVTFGGSLLGTDVAQITVNTSGLGIAVGTQLTCTTTTVATTITHQWLRNGVPIGGETANTYTTTAADEGKTIQCQTFAINSNTGATQVSAPSLAAQTTVSPYPGGAPPTTTQSTIATPAQTANLTVGGAGGQELTCNAGTWTGSPTSYTYQWYRNGVAIGSPTTVAATSSKYTVTAGDIAAAASFQCSVTATNANGAATLASGSRTTSPSPSPPAPTANSVLVPLSAGTTSTNGVTVPEICVPANGDVCKAGFSGTLGGSFASTFSGQPAVVPTGAPNAGNVLVADNRNQRVQEFTASGAFVRAFGADVELPAQAFAPWTFEVCTVAANCKAGPVGNTATTVGAFSGNTPTRVAADASGVIYAMDPANSLEPGRVHRFTPQVGPPTLSPSVFAPDVFVGGTSGTANDLAVDPVDGHVFVAKIQNGALITECPGVQLPSTASERRIYELDSAGNLLDVHLKCSRIASNNGLALRPSTSELLMSSQSYVPIVSESSTNRHGVYRIKDSVPAPVAEVDPVTAVTSTGATLNGKVNPTGQQTFYRYEYKLSNAKDTFQNWVRTPAILLDAGSGNTLAAVSPQPVTGLLPERSYDVRIAAYKAFGDRADVSDITTFTTGVLAPEVQEDIAVFQDGPDTVRFVGRIKPGFGATEYSFHYGTDTSYGSQAKGQILGGEDATNQPVQVSEVITGLQQGVTYHFKLSAINAAGPDESVDSLFELYDQPQIDDRPRIYEKVSPNDKNGADAEPSHLEASISLPGEPHGDVVATDGGAVGYYSTQSFGDIPYGAGGIPPGYIARRTPEGWFSKAELPIRTVDGKSPENYIGDVLWSGNLTRMILTSSANLLTPDTSPGTAFFQFDHDTETISRHFNRVGDGMSMPVWGTPDLSRYVLNDRGILTGDVGAPDQSTLKVYTRNADGFVLESIQPNDSPFTTPAVAGSALTKLDGGAGAPGTAAQNAISEDGNHVFFSTPAGSPAPATAKIYRRSNRDTTTLVSPSKVPGGDSQGEKAKLYITATPDQSEDGPAAVFFTSQEQLTIDANTGPTRSGNELYRYEINTDTLTAISAETNDANGAEVLGLVDVSSDGNWVYYVAKGQIVVGKGTAGQPNLYLWHDDGTADGETRYLTTLADSVCNQEGLTPILTLGDGCNYAHSLGPGTNRYSYEFARTSRISADGQRLLFQSHGKLTSYDNAGFDQIYLYDARGRGGEGQIVCVSCDPSGTPATEPTHVARGLVGRAPAGELPRILSSDGRRVFFETAMALVPNDDNNKQDIYQWEDGEFSLISNGHGNRDSKWIGASRSGNDVFFSTIDRLDPRGGDVDGLSDVYTARVGGGFGPLTAPPAPCTGEDCKAVPVPQPDASTPPTSTMAGSGNLNERAANRKPRCAKGKVRRKSRCVPKKQRKAKRNAKSNRGGAK